MTDCPACAGITFRPSYLGQGRYGEFSFVYLTCSDCESVFVNPMPAAALLDAIYGPAYLATHYAAELSGATTRQETQREINEGVRLLSECRPHGRVLDIGCGAGRFLTQARAAGLMPEGYERLAQTAQRVTRVTGCEVHAGELADLKPGYDMVHLADVLEHSPCPLDLLRQVERLLVPDGLLLLRGPLENQANLFQQAIRWSRLLKGVCHALPPTIAPPYHVILFTYAGWRALMRRVGLGVLQERVYEVHWPVPEQFRWQVRPILKELSLRLSASRWGRRHRMGNRVLSLAVRARPCEKPRVEA